MNSKVSEEKNSSDSANWLARTAIAGTVFFLVVMYVVFVFIQPELNPLYRYGSEYAAGPMGWLMRLAFFCWGLALVALAIALAKGLDAEARSNVGIAFVILAACGICSSGIFDSDLQIRNENPPPRWIEGPASEEQVWHAVSGLVGLLSLMIGAGLVSRRLRRANRLHGPYRWLRALSWAAPVAFLLFAAIFVPYGLAGLGQRIFLLFLLVWVILAARGLATDAFSPS